MDGHVLLVVGQTKTIDVSGERAEAALEGHGDIGASELTVLNDVVDLEVGVEIGVLLLDVNLYLSGRLFYALLDTGVFLVPVPPFLMY